ncbi:unnamed protein product, partial [Trichogramma brassicae]
MTMTTTIKYSFNYKTTGASRRTLLSIELARLECFFVDLIKEKISGFVSSTVVSFTKGHAHMSHDHSKRALHCMKRFSQAMQVHNGRPKNGSADSEQYLGGTSRHSNKIFVTRKSRTLRVDAQGSAGPASLLAKAATLRNAKKNQKVSPCKRRTPLISKMKVSCTRSLHSIVLLKPAALGNSSFNRVMVVIALCCWSCKGGHGATAAMFSELCRETLRKAAVYYNSGRTSASSSPPSSPPPSPQRNSRIVARDSRRRMLESFRLSPREWLSPQENHGAVYEIREKRQAHPTNVSSRRTTSGLESRDGRRLPYVASVDLSTYSSSNYKEQPYKKFYYQCHRRGRSASPEMLRNCYFEDRSPGSSPEPDDSSGDE